MADPTRSGYPQQQQRQHGGAPRPRRSPFLSPLCEPVNPSTQATQSRPESPRWMTLQDATSSSSDARRSTYLARSTSTTHSTSSTTQPPSSQQSLAQHHS
ncbi:hypothetical protein BDZ90DRAFT_262525 [Jaminaea rosea]|uniref:Uncharacterized protein n=1 Tax=Jaminaea rosea TaxID=1569628 RepID=A0A316UL23_9BASI|nr:hypothetical protein BDZ90DRAFT_262525 [Jaminaea rosea]PWN25071.1 hypothetical protein BDZ90DRAFT_262525 [Jaminaea rosea]